MIHWKEEVNLSLRNLSIDYRELNHEEAILFIIDLYKKHKKSYLWLQNEFFNNRVSFFAIRALLIREGVPRRSRGGDNRRKFECSKEELENSTLEEVKFKYGVCLTTILKRRKEYGITGRCKRAKRV